ncbi:MAG: hypothetical protein JXA77_02425 [Bacteroidales bacterium]|nr:hypothetical protein [Bacteroidales bacterium]MBN2817796.1 hypothetical protein [Bacteroidales bacterium]
MQKIILSIGFLLFVTYLFGQKELIADAGPDKAVCVGLWEMDTIQIGGNPTAEGGDGAYKYSWETVNKISPTSDITYFASNYLNDTTLSNPKVIQRPTGMELVFYLTVRDSSGNTSRDNVRVIFSQLKYNIGGPVSFVTSTDSVQLNSEELIRSNLPLDSVAWFPISSLSAPYNTQTWAKPTTSMIYNVYIQDTAGCSGVSTGGWKVEYLTKNNEEKIETTPFVYYNSVQRCFQIGGDSYNIQMRLTLHDLAGRKIFDEKLGSNIVSFDTEETLIIYLIRNIHGTYISSGQVLIK